MCGHALTLRSRRRVSGGALPKFAEALIARLVPSIADRLRSLTAGVALDSAVVRPCYVPRSRAGASRIRQGPGRVIVRRALVCVRVCVGPYVRVQTRIPAYLRHGAWCVAFRCPAQLALALRLCSPWANQGERCSPRFALCMVAKRVACRQPSRPLQSLDANAGGYGPGVQSVGGAAADQSYRNDGRATAPGSGSHARDDGQHEQSRKDRSVGDGIKGIPKPITCKREEHIRPSMLESDGRLDTDQWFLWLCEQSQASVKEDVDVYFGGPAEVEQFSMAFHSQLMSCAPHHPFSLADKGSG